MAGKKEPYWLIYVAIMIAGILLLAQAFGWIQLNKLTARLGIALIYSAIAMLVGQGRWAGNLATVIVWLGVALTYFI